MIYWQNRTKIFSRSLMVKWQKSFSEKYEDNTPGKRGRPKEIDDQTVKTIDDVIREDRWRIEKILGISKSSIHRILSDNLGMHRVFARWVPRLLKVEEKTREFRVRKKFLDGCDLDRKNSSTESFPQMRHGSIITIQRESENPVCGKHPEHLHLRRQRYLDLPENTCL